MEMKKNDWTDSIRDIPTNEARTYERMRYIYCYDWEILSMHDSISAFKNWCFADMMDNGGEYADRKEVVE